MRTPNKRIVRAVLMFGIVLLPLPGLVSCAPSPPSPTTQIDWVNFVQFGGITYLANALHVGRSLQTSDLGPEFAKVRFRLEGNVHDPGYRTKDGDAAILAAGTSVYMVKGYAPTFRLAAHSNTGLLLFEADTNPKAKTGADLLDLAQKVRYIGVNSEQDGTTELASIKDPQQVTRLVTMVLEAPVDQTSVSQGGTRYFLAFHLTDGTAVTRAYWLNSGELARGILLPRAFRTAIEQALKR
jgi:hypothetical protein